MAVYRPRPEDAPVTMAVLIVFFSDPAETEKADLGAAYVFEAQYVGFQI